MSNVTFKISSALKTIIGKELITDDFIAVFELVKNAFDANARKVEIIFDGLRTENPSIIIKDDGDGMDENDIRNKWLFVAYSAKKLEQDYRDKIKANRVYAGAKGIGRFSCDRLGAKLKLTTRKKNEDNHWHVLNIDWSDFEDDPEEEFQTIKANLSTIKKAPFSKIKYGTILEISELRSEDWTRDKLLKLRQSLERLINPNQGNDVDNFSIILKVPDEEPGDAKIKKEKPAEPWNIVNGPIRNFLFEALETKTTQIQLEIDSDGEFLTTRLIDRGTLIYELIENNPYLNILHDIRITLFYLDRSAKIIFHRRMGLPSVQYGSVFVYKNGFRIHPYGDARTDSLGLDRRKQQGYNRFLGSRELSGRIEINGKNPEFQETSSRDGGLIFNAAFESLLDLLRKYALVRLESYVIDLRKFGKGIDNLDQIPEIRDPNSSELRNFAFDLVVKLTKSKDVLDINYDANILDILENRSAESVTALLKNLKRITLEQNKPQLLKEISKAEQQIAILAKAKEEAETETAKERKRAEQAEEQAREAKAKAQEATEAARRAQEETKDISTQNLFLKSVLSKDLQHVIELYHTVGQDADAIEISTSTLLGIIRDESKTLKPEMLRASLERINITARRINTISRFATHANFRADSEVINADLTAYIREYLLNVYGGFILDPQNRKIAIQFLPATGEEFITRFTPIKVSIVIDNLIYNSRKHKSKQITVSVCERTSDKLTISLKDDGQGIPKKNFSKLFAIGFSTTNGSGLGLHHSKSLMLEMNGDLVANENVEQGAEFILIFTKGEEKQ